MTSIGDLNFVTVHGNYTDMSTDTALAGSLHFAPSTVVLDAGSGVGLIIMPSVFSVTLDGSGNFTIDLPATDDPDVLPVGWSYSLTENIGSVGRNGLPVNVPIAYLSSGVALATLLATSVQSSGTTSFALLADLVALEARVTALETAIDGGGL